MLCHKLQTISDKLDDLLVAINRLDERTKSMQSQMMVIGGGTLVAVLVGIILQIIFR